MSLLTTTVARVAFGLPFVVFGIFHFMMSESMVNMVPSWLPAQMAWVYITGVALIAAGVAILLGKMGKNACLGLALLLASFVLFIHIPGVQSGNPMAMPNLLKDLALMGGALTWAGIFEKEEG